MAEPPKGPVQTKRQTSDAIGVQKPDRVGQLEQRNLLAGNSTPIVSSPVSDLSIATDVEFGYTLRPAGTVMFGYDVGGTDVTAIDNYFVSTVRLRGFEDVSFSGNTILSQDPIKVLLLDVVPSSATLNGYAWDSNEYITNTRQPFVFGSSKSWDEWKSETGLDGASTLIANASGTFVNVRPNRYEPGRGHLVVYNWNRLDRVDIDLSGVVSQGSAYQIYNVLDLEGAPVLSGVYTGGSVWLPMTDDTATVPIGHVPVAPVTVDKEFGAFLIVSEAAPIPASGREFYVAPHGTAAGGGSRANPWDLATAMSHPRAVRPGDTIWILGGTYSGRLTSRLSGTAAAPIHVRAFPGADVKLDMHLGHPALRKLLTIEGQYTRYQGLEVFSSDPSLRTTKHVGSWPPDIDRGNINVFGDHIELINMRVHDLNKGLGYWTPAEGGELYGSLIYNNGWSGPDRKHGHGLYSQNEDSLRRIEENVIFNQFRNGINIYGSNTSSLKNYLLEGNVSFNNGAGAGAGFVAGFQILIGGGTLAENVTVRENYTYVGKYTFQDFDAGDHLTLLARQANGKPLPSWLTFHESEGYFVGTPTANDVGTIAIELIATDSAGAAVTDEFLLTVYASGDTAPASIHRLVEKEVEAIK